MPLVLEKYLEMEVEVATVRYGSEPSRARAIRHHSNQGFPKIFAISHIEKEKPFYGDISDLEYRFCQAPR